jgi:hypothetical protein
MIFSNFKKVCENTNLSILFWCGVFIHQKIKKNYIPFFKKKILYLTQKCQYLFYNKWQNNNIVKM